MLFSFVFPHLHSFDDLETFYITFVSILVQPHYTHAEIDLRAITFFAPEALMSLLCASNIWYNTKGTPMIWLIEQEESLQYLERMDIFSTCREFIRPSRVINQKWSRGASDQLVEIRAISHETEQNSLDVPHLVNTAQGVLLGRVNAKQLGPACTILSEITQNVPHSKRQGYAFMQVYQGQRVHICVGDTGIGIPITLMHKYPGLGLASSYIKKSLESGVTSSEAGRGLGLYQVEQLVGQGKGILTIRSHTAMLQIRDNRVHVSDHLTDIPGTHVFITLWGRHEKTQWSDLLPNA